MINEGVLQNSKVDAVFGLHLWSPIPTGKIGGVAGPLMTSSYYFKLLINGKGGHGGALYKAINPLNPALDIIHDVRTIKVEEFDVKEPTLITIGRLHSGAMAIIIPDTLEMEGSIRCLHEKEKHMYQRFNKLVNNIYKNYRTTH